jgi:hypothetical protein
MSDPNNDETFEKHRRLITNLGTEGLVNTVEQEYEKAAEGKEKKTVEGVCPVCKEQFIPGFAVRCSEPSCSKLIFHQSCFGTHTMQVHQPRSITIIMRGTKTPGTWEYVDADTVPFTLPELGRVETGVVIPEEDPPAGIVFHGPDDDSTVQLTSGDPNISVPENTISAIDTKAPEKLGKTTRTKKRAKTEE